MNAKSATATAIISMFCLAAGPAFAQPGSGSACNGGGNHSMPSAVNVSIAWQKSAPPYIFVHQYSSKRFASAFSAAYAAPPVAILKSRKGGSDIVLSDVPVHACRTGSRAAFARDRHGDVVYGCERSTDDHFSVCWKGYGCHRYQSSKWDLVALSKPAAVTPSHR